MPKHRQTLFAVVREIETMENFQLVDAVITGVYTTLDRAMEVKDAQLQEMHDRFGAHNHQFVFSVFPVTYYDE